MIPFINFHCNHTFKKPTFEKTVYVTLICETHTNTYTPMSPNTQHSHDRVPLFWLQTVGGAGITTQWYSRRGALYINPTCQQMFLMTERLFQLKPEKSEECKRSNAVISTILTASKENTVQHCVLILFNSDH